MTRPTSHLPHSSLFQISHQSLVTRERISLSYKRARAIGLAYALSAEDVLDMSQKFWDMHQDPIVSLDGAAATLLTIQYNLGVGYIGKWAKVRPELRPLLQRILKFEVSAQYCLTEVGHGLDAIHMETTATLLPDGSFDLHTPLPRAAKYMPPTTPVGVPCIAIVMAKLLVDAEDRGVRPFLVALNDGVQMCSGITAKELPPRGGAWPLNHSLTYFNHVQLASDALLGTLAMPVDLRLSFLESIERVRVGSFAIGSMCIPLMQVAAFITAKYSLRRTVDASGSSGKNTGLLVPIISFRTQQIPILTALAQAYVLKAFHAEALKTFTNFKIDPRVRHGIGAVLKVIMVQHCQTANISLSDRCGSQGLYEYNQLSGQFGEMRGIAIAEGDVLLLSIRLASELLIGRYALAPPIYPDSLLARHEIDLYAEHRQLISTFEHHRSTEFDRFILPQCQLLVQALGHRLAYEAAVEAKVRPELIDLYVASCVKLDSAWYVENAGLSRRAQIEMEDKAINSTFPLLEDLLRETDVDGWVLAPIVTEEGWEAFVAELPTVSGDGYVETAVNSDEKRYTKGQDDAALRCNSSGHENVH